jgi:alkanesulfonate monooxygenase SsuD/methylene tetrahydromethanopterin reductase-like flavin-dependent oxidoreductase (luciferase family)
VLWTSETVEWHSELYNFDDVTLKPQPLFDVPVWWGGATPASARLAVDFCQGWLPGRITFPTYEVRVAKIRELAAEQGKPMIWAGAVPVTSIDDSFVAATARMNVSGLIKNANAQKFWLSPTAAGSPGRGLDGSILASAAGRHRPRRAALPGDRLRPADLRLPDALPGLAEPDRDPRS